MKELEKSILATLVYYDILNRPLTQWEILKCLKKVSKNQTQVSFLEVKEALEKDTLKKLIDSQNGFYFLKNRFDLVEERIKRQKISEEKMKLAKKISFFLQMVPYLRMVAISGSLAFGNGRQESDIDLLIAVKKGRIWLTRILITALTQLAGRRRHGNKNQDGICLNHYLSDDNLKIDYHSLYNAQTYIHLIPLIDKENTFLKFKQANSWISQYLLSYPFFQKNTFNLKAINLNPFLNFLVKLKEVGLNNFLGDSLEYLSKKWQLRHIKKTDQRRKEKSLQLNQGPIPGRIILDDSQLEFHPDSAESNILAKYNQKMRQMGFSEIAQEKDSGLVA